MENNREHARNQRRLREIENDPDYFMVNLARHGITGQIRDCFRNNVGLHLKNKVLYFAAYNGHLEIVDLVLAQYGGDANFEFNVKKTRPIHVAVSEGHLEIVKKLIDHGASVSAADKRRQTPLMMTCRYDQLEIAQILIQHGAQMNAAKTNGTTIVHIASAFSREELFHLIMDNNPNCKVVNKNGETPLMLALDGGLNFIYPLVKRQLEIDGNLYSLDKAIIAPSGPPSNLLQQRSIQNEERRLAEERKAPEPSPSEHESVEDESGEDESSLPSDQDEDEGEPEPEDTFRTEIMHQEMRHRRRMLDLDNFMMLDPFERIPLEIQGDRFHPQYTEGMDEWGEQMRRENPLYIERMREWDEQMRLENPQFIERMREWDELMRREMMQVRQRRSHNFFHPRSMSIESEALDRGRMSALYQRRQLRISDFEEVLAAMSRHGISQEEDDS